MALRPCVRVQNIAVGISPTSSIVFFNIIFYYCYKINVGENNFQRCRLIPQKESSSNPSNFKIQKMFYDFLIS